MSSYNLPGGGAPGDAEMNPKFESLLAQLRLQSSPSPGPGTGTGTGQEYHGQYNNYNHGNPPFYGGHHTSTDSPSLPGHAQHAADSPAFLPEAPTPPVAFSHSQYSPGLVNQMTAARAGGAAPNDDRTAHLLNLLKFSGQSGPANPHRPSSGEPPVPYAPAPIAPPVIHAPAPAAADPTGLLAALMKGNLPSEPVKPEPEPEPEPEPVQSTWNQASSPPTGTQQYLLNLLNRPKPSQHDAPEPDEPSLLTPLPAREDTKDNESSHGDRSVEPTLVGTLASRSEFEFGPKNIESPPPKFGSTPHSQHSQQSSSRPGILGYSDHFDGFSASSPIHRTPKSSTTPGASGSIVSAVQQPTQILKKPDHAQPIFDPTFAPSEHGQVGSPDHARHSAHVVSPPSSSAVHVPVPAPAPPETNISPVPPDAGVANASFDDNAARPFAAEQKKESVSEAVSGLAEQADREATEALARAEQEQTDSADAALDQDYDAYAGKDFGSSGAAPSFANKGRSGEEGRALLDSAISGDYASGARDSGDDVGQANQGAVAESWESVEAEEVAANEETATPVKVYNFPMKPWITISLQEIDEPRPVFREEAILDIARLKKEFDQIDRNLVSASETYMAYGMSKAGGFRVIRQDDGKDAKLFTDTKDRIFNVAISSSPSHAHPKEAIIGTGVSGTVYWVQLKNGDRDHLEDAHPEQYGFALPPISAQEGGDAPGGVLKTRARTSAMHPEFFAVGRGKSINIIWPSFIFENQLFKNGHDRVVDTDRLLKQCSLKISTGKAGKDFTFSQDDTLVVSLDKSGRVKFWDVRELTAPREGSDPVHPLPARTSLEIKEPLMTLTTTPEGEKAWPTSVLLLDKFRPYQKRAALRYMIVGMKQNHTLQLWDLALGKPVQEFNFPHNKESDAVCSVMYHAPSSMIIVGHPTRNSIYFLHLSAPKYTLKNLSQVEYIQRLVAQDSSIPQPESTAVISGIREYSFANKGVLRSLNILENPQASGDSDEQTLFELYAMHSKGVTCLCIKQSELGWNKDNKVVSPADAVEAGLAKISKLIAPPPPPPAESQHATPAGDAAPAPQIRIATRGNKDAVLKGVSPQGDDKKGAESSAPPKFERKDETEAPAPAPEKNEKKGRKKKGAAAAAAAAGDQAPPNGGFSSQGKANNRLSRNADTSSADAAQNKASADFSTIASSSISQEQLDAVVAKMESRIVSNLQDRFDAVFHELLKQMQTFQDNRDSAFSNNQSALLQMVADVLNDNTEAVLKNLVISQINDNVIPSVRTAIDRTVADQMTAKSSAQVSAIQKEIQRLLPGAVSQALQKPDFTKSVSDKLAQAVAGLVEAQIAKTLNALAPVIANTTAKTVHQRIVDDVNGRISAAFDQLEERRREEDAKLDRLIAQTRDLSNAISSLAASQTQVLQEIAALKQQMHSQDRDRASIPEEHPRSHGHSHSATGSHGLPSGGSRDLVAYPVQHAPHQQHQHQSPAAVSLPHSVQPPYAVHQAQYANQPEHQVYAPISRDDRQKMELDSLIETIDGLMRSAKYDEAMLRWLQSGDHAEEVFQQVLSKYNPIFVQELQPLLLLSVGATVSVDLSRTSPKIMNKVDLLEVVIYAFNQNLQSLDDQVREVTPKIMNLLKTRIEQLLIDISRIAPHDGAIKKLSSMSQVATRIAESVQMRHGTVHTLGHIGAPY
ncbi:hypothetical protein VTJ49DRAFT_3510 [Mycothermus thermophilus]|uniref:EDC4-like protein pdc1 beta-propeller domain-containing protein n=1 Tax=Humicola insolens TaxID=85995 RepID=A0ABR3V7B9_HUMIN